MPRQAKIGQKNGHWYSEAGGKARYFGRVDDTPYASALKRFREALASPGADREAKPKPMTVGELKTLFLAWLERHRGYRTHYERSRHLQRFAKAYGKRKASEVDGTHLEAFTAALAKRGAALDWQHKHEVSVRAMFRWGVKHGHLPNGFNPFATVEPIRPPGKALLESDLPTPNEVRNIIASATPTLASILRIQHATGARSGELLNARVGDYQPATRQIVLARHKREKTMREPRPRVIVLNAEADAIVARLCSGRVSDAPLFMTPTGKRWSDKLLSYHFANARTKAKIRETMTPYALRHLWISEALMAGLDAMLVAKMAGTSVGMVERVYGRFRAQSYAEAQARLDAARASRCGA
jgi:integrase